MRFSAGIVNRHLVAMQVILFSWNPELYCLCFILSNLYPVSTQIMYGVLYTISPEIFSAKDHGTGNGLVFMATQIFGLIVSLFELLALSD